MNIEIRTHQWWRHIEVRYIDKPSDIYSVHKFPVDSKTPLEELIKSMGYKRTQEYELTVHPPIIVEEWSK